MFISKTLLSIGTLVKKSISNTLNFILNIPKLCREKMDDSKIYCADFRCKLSNLAATNLELGVYHLYLLNLNDAIIRFKLVIKFFDKGNKEACYWLGWCYFLKNNYKQALYYLEQSDKEDQILLKDFIKNYNNYDTIPTKIWQQYRDLLNEHYSGNFDSNDIHLPYRFVQKTLTCLSTLPSSYNIMELGSNIGLIGYDIRKRFPDSFTLKAVEISTEMIESSQLYYKNTNIYDLILNDHITEVMSHTSETFDVVLSFCGFTFTKNLKDCFDNVYAKLNQNGYFAFCLPIDASTFFSMKRKEFVFDTKLIKHTIEQSKLQLLLCEEVVLKADNQYIMCICQKLQ